MFAQTKVFLYVVIYYSCFVSLAIGAYEECEDIEPGTYVASLESCSSYILCNGDDSDMYECDEGQYFDSENEVCDDKDNVVCPLDDSSEEEVEGEVEGEGGGEGENENEKEPSPTVFTSTTDLTTSSTPATIIDIIPIVKEICPSADDPNQIVYMTSNNSCSDYYVCYHGHPVEMHCTDHLHFNTLSGKCDFPENANCKLQNQSPPTATNICLPHITDFFPHTRKCNYFFYCIKGYQTLQQCPFYYGWDVERRTCVHMSLAKCYNKAR